VTPRRQAADDKPDAAPTFRLILKPLPTCADPIRSLRWALKTLLRRHHLRCVSCEEVRRD
jgi:hypothetical protein